MITAKQIDSFLSKKKIAVIGASRDTKKFSAQSVSLLESNGYSVYMVNPNYDSTVTDRKYLTIEELPADIESALIMTPKSQTEEVFKRVINKNIKNIWVQQNTYNKSLVPLFEQADGNIIYGNCIFKFINPTGPHKFHRILNKIFGLLPK